LSSKTASEGEFFSKEAMFTINELSREIQKAATSAEDRGFVDAFTTLTEGLGNHLPNEVPLFFPVELQNLKQPPAPLLKLQNYILDRMEEEKSGYVYNAIMKATSKNPGHKEAFMAKRSEDFGQDCKTPFSGISAKAKKPFEITALMFLVTDFVHDVGTLQKIRRLIVNGCSHSSGPEDVLYDRGKDWQKGTSYIDTKKLTVSISTGKRVWIRFQECVFLKSDLPNPNPNPVWIRFQECVFLKSDLRILATNLFANWFVLL
jgi:hypothetical protein